MSEPEKPLEPFELAIYRELARRDESDCVEGELTPLERLARRIARAAAAQLTRPPNSGMTTEQTRVTEHELELCAHDLEQLASLGSDMPAQYIEGIARVEGSLKLLKAMLADLARTQ
jgi:hypothetical protein